MIMHGTWYKGPQLAHHSHTDYHQYRSYPSFVVTPFHDSNTNTAGTTPLSNPSAPIIVEGTFASVNQLPTQLTVLSPTIKIEQSFAEPTIQPVEDYSVHLDCSVENHYRKPNNTNNYNWPTAITSEANNNNLTTLPNSGTSTPPTTPNSLQLETNHHHQQTQQHQQQQQSPPSATSTAAAAASSGTSSVLAASLGQHHKSLNNSSSKLNNTNTTTTIAPTTMPISGVQGQNPTQGLVHWMSAVMAEHMTGQTHHDPSAVAGMHYMWNGNVDHCGQHAKDISDYNVWPPPAARNHMSVKQGYEAKMNDHHGNLQKGHFLDDNRLEHHSVTPQGGGVIGGTGSATHHSNHVGHHSSAVAAASAALLVVPQPINATKIGSSLSGAGGGGGGGGGTGRKYQCKMCPQIFSSKADLQLHTQIHMREAKPYKCTQCSKAFANSSYLSQHTRIHLGIKPYRCEICQRKFTQLSHLQQHIRTHTGDKPYKCRHPGCQKAFSQLSNLQSHSRSHQTDKPFKCNSCYKCFSDEPSLLEHIPKHKESKHLKTHICQYCGKSYTQETYLTKHMQKHAERTDKRPPIVATNTANANAVNNNNNNNNAMQTGNAGPNPNNSGPSGVPTGGQQHNRNIGLPPVSIAPTDNNYWPKVSPDSAANMNEVMHQQQQHPHHHQQQQQQQHHHQQQQHQAPQPQHLDYSHQAAGPNNSSAGGGGPQTNGHTDIHIHHRMTDNTREDIVSTPSTVGPYDAASITKTTSNSAFTPINSMPPHLNSLSHHAMAQRPYLYDAISFQKQNVNQNNANSFPNQLISLHQIRNYAHQPGGLMAGEHLLGVSVGPGKDKG